MNEAWENIFIEIGLFCLLGVLYYFYQKRKIIQYEKNKGPRLADILLQLLLIEKKENQQPQIDALIDALDEFLKNPASQFPTALLKKFTSSSECTSELKSVIEEVLEELEK